MNTQFPDNVVRAVVLQTNCTVSRAEDMLKITRGSSTDAIHLIKNDTPEALTEYRLHQRERREREEAESALQSRRCDMSIAIDEAARKADYKIEGNFEEFLSTLLATVIK